jgi:hypothetical protein
MLLSGSIMDIFDATDIVRRFWLDRANGISSQEVVLAKCPFCGKTDRIRLIPLDQPKDEPPDQEYQAAIEMLSSPGGTLGICRFCLNVVQVHKQGQERR